MVTATGLLVGETPSSTSFQSDEGVNLQLVALHKTITPHPPPKKSENGHPTHPPS